MHIIQEGLLSPSPDISAMLSEMTSTEPGTSSESLSQVVAFNVSQLISQAPEISEKVLFNVHESLLKDWGPESVGALPEDTMQQQLTELS